MNLTQLTVFREVMETGSISQTAKKLGRTQPAITLAIQNLERSLDLKLFERRGRQLIPVPEAHYLMAEATEILDRLSTVSSTIKGLLNADSGSLNIATMPGPSTYIFPKFISEAIGGNQNIRLTLSSRGSPQIMELASAQNIDFGFADFFDPHRGKRSHYDIEIIRANCFCALNKDHPLAHCDIVFVEDLADLPLGTLRADHPFPHRVARAFQKKGINFNTVMTSQFFLPLLPMIGVGHCNAIVDPLTAVTERELGSSNGRVVFVPFDPSITYEYAILKPTHRPPSQLALKILAGWKTEVLRMLTEIGAKPVVEHFDSSVD